MKRKSKIEDVIKLICLMCMCSLTAMWGVAIPAIMQIMLWAIYVAEILVLSCRLFRIKISTISNVLNIIQSNNQKKDL